MPTIAIGTLYGELVDEGVRQVYACKDGDASGKGRGLGWLFHLPKNLWYSPWANFREHPQGNPTARLYEILGTVERKTIGMSSAVSDVCIMVLLYRCLPSLNFSSF